MADARAVSLRGGRQPFHRMSASMAPFKDLAGWCMAFLGSCFSHDKELHEEDGDDGLCYYWSHGLGFRSATDRRWNELQLYLHLPLPFYTEARVYSLNRGVPNRRKIALRWERQRLQLKKGNGLPAEAMIDWRVTTGFPEFVNDISVVW
ncbi:hypothetical protein OPV22_034590 [Ensete ventricosum]|uniref:Uncharacterized protein n=1 Tax=Ensete ventricosum TaxID=4639 RepID=A0AAV8PPX9_ENSVE|nr:hypothetical protein OPV22_034590 [Ensete ventricosum]